MKYLIIVYDGMADRPIPALGGKTPMQVAKTPVMDKLSVCSTVGTVSNVPNGMVPESDTANLAILSYDPRVFSKGRSPLEAMSMRLEMSPEDTAYRTNIVTLSEEEGIPYAERTILDHSSDEISTEEADVLIRAVDEAFGNSDVRFHTGISYRHCLLVRNGDDTIPFARPHDHLGAVIGEFLPEGEAGLPFRQMMGGRVVTFQLLLQDEVGALFKLLPVFVDHKANIQTINSIVPTNGCAVVTISAETIQLTISVEELLQQLRRTPGVVKADILL